MKHTVNVTNARNNFSDILNRVQYRGDEFMIKKQGKEIARIIGIDKGTSTSLGKSVPPVFSMGGAKDTYSREEIYDK